MRGFPAIILRFQSSCLMVHTYVRLVAIAADIEPADGLGEYLDGVFDRQPNLDSGKRINRVAAGVDLFLSGRNGAE